MTQESFRNCLPPFHTPSTTGGKSAAATAATPASVWGNNSGCNYKDRHGDYHRHAGRTWAWHAGVLKPVAVPTQSSCYPIRGIRKNTQEPPGSFERPEVTRHCQILPVMGSGVIMIDLSRWQIWRQNLCAGACGGGFCFAPRRRSNSYLLSPKAIRIFVSFTSLAVTGHGF